ncbi:Signal transduction histidine kinase regulating C4-dicarboxylate transport system [Alloalcanivorax dieselolei B5]|uniref:C4-dicarboxylate transport sensor protein DctB n=1 Tax=Alcanivorax dieselolei (strain DSM 16502 / CGMCC 1.3690 / MCCC 1A00001 / B-5) TaxID=930169 RepID=K0C9Z8_ALCDB|nr:Signal transduction histidine kinase regulating C4-dicarboxylate transport system [Alloalcanivorax dieselolei B5]
MLFLVTALFSWQLGAWSGYRLLERESLKESFRYSQLVDRELKRYRPIPELMAEHPLLRAALEEPADPELVLRANNQMKRMATIIGSSDVYLMDHRGLTIAASNHDRQDSFIGRNFDFRPYFNDAIRTGAAALYFALGSTSDVRGLYFAFPIQADTGGVLGVVAAKVQVTELESQWQRPASFTDAEMVVLDGDGFSFLASRRQWLYRDFMADGEGPSESISRARLRYPRRALTPMDIEYLGRPLGVSPRSRLVRIRDEGAWREYLSVQTPLPELDWDLEVMLGTRQVFWSQVRFLVMGLVVFLGAMLTWLYLKERYRREAELAQRGVQLEQRVAERTADLEASNRKLINEVHQREEAQNELREIQQELIQAAKLAVLGQMSAGLNHEMSQPLTAIQSYARNSQRFLERGDNATVDANLAEIVTLCGKMAELTRQFKVFARKSEGRPASVDLRQPVDAALKIIHAQDSGEGVGVDWQRPAHPVMCHGDLIRIEQVMVNLLTNALHALEGTEQPMIQIDIQDNGGTWQCRVRDNGPGLPGNSEQIFEPFFTTKSMKQGLGLGLSISRQIMDALGGRLTGQNREDGPGAEFILTLHKREAAE